MLAAIATIASMALPPCASTSRPASAARLCGAATAALAKKASSDMRVPFRGSPCYRLAPEFAKGSSLAVRRPINWPNAVTLASVAVLVGAEFVGAGVAAGWAIGGLFLLGDLITHALETAFVLIALT